MRNRRGIETGHTTTETVVCDTSVAQIPFRRKRKLMPCISNTTLFVSIDNL